MRTSPLALVVCLLASYACTTSHASVRITETRVERLADANRVAVEIDLVASEAMGGNIGMYCTRVTFPGQENPVEQCRTDLEDGDMATLRIVSDHDVPETSLIQIRVRHANVDVGRSLVPPPH